MKASRLVIPGFCVAVVLLQPTLTQHYYNWMLQHGAYRPEADSIAIPIMESFMLWVIAAPVILGVIAGAFWRTQRPIRLLAWQADQKVKSVVLTVLFGGLALLTVLDLPSAIRWRNAVEILYSLCWTATWLLVRSGFLTEKEPNQALQTTPTTRSEI